MREAQGAPRGTELVDAQGVDGVGGADASAHVIRAFLIADIRGYTTFTEDHGDEAAAALATAFAERVASVTNAAGGTLVELRGDEALAVFASPRQAIQAAVAIQDRLLEEAISGTGPPLPVGIGLDVGEAVPVGDGYRGGALNLAARLCAEAAAGEILASQGFTHLARVVEGVDYRDRGAIRLKGIADPVHVVAVSARGADVAEHMRAFSPSATSDGRRSSRGKLQFRLLGPLEVDDGSGPLPLGGPKQRAVLAHLIVRANALVPAETLIDLVWGDEPPETARSIIHTYVSLLRRALGAERIQGQAPGYRLRVDGNELDTVRFDALVNEARRQLPVDPDLAVLTLEDALALWRGPALADLADQRGLFAEAARLDEQRLEAQQARLEGFLATDRPSRAVAELDALVAEHPLDESLWGMLMLALYRDGRQGDALKAFHRARAVIVEELGVDPSPELERLQHRILEHDPGLELRGEPLRGYRLLEKLDDGRSGVLYRAIQPKVGRDVAVRVFHEQVAADPTFVRQFEPQAQRVAALEHPHIAPVYDYWREPGRAYLVTRFLKGGSLRALLERGSTLDAEHAVRVVVEIASALAFAHRQAVVHGDVGPSAIRFDGEGHAYLVDFVLGVDEVADRGGDVRHLAALARRLLPANEGLAELARQSEASTSEIDAEDLAALARGASGPVVSAATPGDPRNPYKGLRPFSEADAGDFFGRTELHGRLLERLSERGPGSRFLAVVGPSGAGKSSVVRAGLVPAIRAGALGDAESTYVAEMLPGPRPFDELADALGRIALHADPRLREVLESGSRGLLTAVDRLVPPGAQLTLVIDQFEEVFTLARDEADRERFLESLRVAALDPEGRLRVVVTLRADFFDRPLVYPRFGELLASRTEAVPPLTPDELEQAIRRPAHAVGLAVEPGLVAEMIADTAHQPGALPLLQYALTELFERRDGARLTLATYQQVGGIAGALTVRADRILDGLATDRRHAARQVFLRLVTLGEGRPDTRRRVPRSELDALDVEREANDEVLEAFGRHRLLTFDREPATREPTVEIAHEALLTAWGRLRGWIDATREDLRQERRLAVSGAEWRAADRDPSFLVRGARLEQVASWADATDLAIGRPERAYLKASLDEREREQSDQDARVRREEQLERRSRFRLRALAAVLAVATIVATSLSLFAVGQEQKATHEAGVARVRELAAAALAEREVDPERAILLAIEAVGEARLVAQPDVVLREATEALHLAIVASRVDQTVAGTGGPVAWGGDDLMATLAVGAPGSVDLRDATSGAIVRTIVAHRGEVTDLAFSPDGRWLATAGADGRLRVWDPSTGRPGAAIEGEGPVSDLAFGADGARVVAAWPDEMVVRVVETSSGRELWRHEGPLVDDQTDGDSVGASALADEDPPAPAIVGLSPDGRRVAIGPGDVWIFDTETGQTAFDPLPVPYGASVVDWSPDGRVIATAGLGGAHVWDAATGEMLDAVFGHASGLNALAWSPDSRRLATGSHDVIVWDYADGRLTESLTLASEATNQGVASLAFSPAVTRLAAGAADGSAVKVWDLTPAGAAEIAVFPSTGKYGDVGFSQGDRQVVSADDDGFVRLHDLDKGDVSPAIGPRVAEHDLDVSPDGRWLVLGPAVWDLTTGSERFRFAEPPPWEASDRTSWSADSRLLAIVSGVEGTAVEVLDLDGKVQSVLQERDGYGTTSVGFSPDGERLVTIGTRWPDGQPETGRITIWDWRQGTVIKDIETPPGEFVTVDPTGRFAATGFGPPAIWDLIDGTHREIEGVDGTTEVAFSPDGSLLAVPVMSTVRLYDTATGKLRLVLGGGRGPMGRLAFSGDASMLAAHGVFQAYVWALDLDRLIAVGQSELTRDWTDDECRRFLHQERCSP